MKKLYPFISMILLQATNLYAQEAVVAGWTFPGNTLTADTGVAVNPDMEIYTVGGTSDIELKNGFETKAAQASGWNNGMEQKGWIVDLNTQGFSNLTISSRQQSGGNDPGPKYFKLQFSTDGGASWSDLDGGNITVENDWETSFVDQLLLPENCENLELLMIRWLMASNEASGSGGNVPGNGKSKIDEVYIRGIHLNSIGQNAGIASISLFPNPASDFLLITSTTKMTEISLFTLCGEEILEVTPDDFSGKINLKSIPPGMYIVQIEVEESLLESRKILVHR